MGREKNQFVDVLATLAFTTKIDYGNRVQPISIEVKIFLAHYCLVEEEVDGNFGYNDIKQFIQHQKYPPGASNTNMKTLWSLAIDYYLDVEMLYNRSSDGTLLRCLDEIEVKKPLQGVHKRICATHVSG